MVFVWEGVGIELKRKLIVHGDDDDAEKNTRICMGGCWKVRTGNRDGTCGRSLLRSVLRL